MKISVIVPVYNEEDQIEITAQSLLQVLEDLDYDFEVLFIDDGSKDETWNAVNSLSDYKRPENENNCTGRVKGFSFSRNFGKEAAINAGLRMAGGDAAIVMDGDLQHPPEYIPQMIEIWDQGQVDVVEGVKASRKGEKLAARLNAFIFYKLFARATGYDLTNASDFKLLDRKVLDQWKLLGEQDRFFRGLSAWMGFKRETFTFEVSKRTQGKSKWPFTKLFRLSIFAFTSFSSIPLQLISLVGSLFLLFSLGLSIQTLVRWFMGKSESGFTTVILLILFTGGAIMLSLGLIGIYVARIFTEVKNRPGYIISKSTEKISPGKN